MECFVLNKYAGQSGGSDFIATLLRTDINKFSVAHLGYCMHSYVVAFNFNVIAFNNNFILHIPWFT
jgi:hypothetical protein